MTLPDITFTGPQVDEERIAGLPAPYRTLLARTNGFVAFRGGLHVRGVCDAPDWHSLAQVQSGEYALHRLFTAVCPTDVPFAQDCLGDQFLLRDGVVHRLSGESGELTSLEIDFDEFFAQAERSPVEFLMLHPLLQFENEGGQLRPEQSLMAYPPFIAAESGQDVSLSAVPKLERIAFLADIARQIAGLPDGAKIVIEFTGEPSGSPKPQQGSSWLGRLFGR